MWRLVALLSITAIASACGSADHETPSATPPLAWPTLGSARAGLSIEYPPGWHARLFAQGDEFLVASFTLPPGAASHSAESRVD